MTSSQLTDILDFWFGGTDLCIDPPPGVQRRWFESNPTFDAEIAARFGSLLDGSVDDWSTSPAGALAAIVVYDQFPRNMFRGHADQFSTDHLALQVARGAVDQELDDALERQERGFLYMPFQHSESLADQKRSLGLFTALGDEEQLGYAKKHHDIIERFGRFPHRNAILGRQPREAEIKAGDVFPW